MLLIVSQQRPTNSLVWILICLKAFYSRGLRTKFVKPCSSKHRQILWNFSVSLRRDFGHLIICVVVFNLKFTIRRSNSFFLFARFMIRLEPVSKTQTTDSCSVNVRYFGNKLYANTKSSFLRQVDPDNLKTIEEKVHHNRYQLVQFKQSIFILFSLI